MRKITSLILIISGIIELFSSIILYIIPSGRVAYWADYHIMGLSKHQWGDVHITVGTLFLIAAIIHTYYNWSPIITYLKNKMKKLTIFTKSFNIALIITIYVTVGTPFKLPPMNYILQLGEYFTEEANKKYGEPPYGHAEQSSLKMFCNKMRIELTKAVKLLRDADIKITDTKETLEDIAKKNNITSQKLYKIIKPPFSQKIKNITFPKYPNRGFGKKTITEICQEYGLPYSKVINKIEKAGFKIQENETIKEIGSNNNSNPMAIFEIIQEIAGK